MGRKQRERGHMSASQSPESSSVSASSQQNSGMSLAQQNGKFTGTAIAQLLSLSFMSFALGMSQFLIVGMLPSVAHDLNMDPAIANQLTIWYAFGICVGLALLPIARKITARWFMVLMGVLILVSNLLTFVLGNWATGAWGWLLFSRFLAGMPHGTFFGADSLLAPRLAPKGKEGQAVSIVVTGQTIANIIGVPVGAALAASIGWANVYLIIVCVALIAIILAAATLPEILIVDTSKQKKGVVTSAMRHAPFWIGLIAIYLGATGYFTWYNNVSTWAETNGHFISGGFTATSTTWMLVVAGIGMFIGSTLSGRLVDKWSPVRSTIFGLVWEVLALLLIGICSPFLVGKAWLVYALVFIATCSLFYISGTPAQLVANDLTAAGLTGGVIFNLAVNAGNFTGTFISGPIAHQTHSWGSAAWLGFVIALISVLLFLYLLHDENRRFSTLEHEVEADKIG